MVERIKMSYDLHSVVGIDEAGRGALAGPLFIAACLLHTEISGIKDSKELSEKKRVQLFGLIKENSNYLILSFSHRQIDECGLSSCLKRALIIIQRHFTGFKCLYDGNTNFGVSPIQTLIKADSKVLQVGAASILAKVSRDTAMNELDESFAVYGFAKHKGYASKAHIDAIARFGLSKIHRKSFKLKCFEKTLFE